MKKRRAAYVLALFLLSAVSALPQTTTADFSGQWSGSLHSEASGGKDDTGVLILDNREAWLYGRDRRTGAYYVEYAFAKSLQVHATSAVLILLRDGVTDSDYLSQSIVLQLSQNKPDSLEASWSEQNTVSVFGSPPPRTETRRGEGTLRRTGFLDESLRADRADLASGKISKEAALRILDAFPRNPQDPNDLDRAEAMLRFLGASTVSRRDANSATGVFGPAEITFWRETYGKRDTFGIRYGPAGSGYQGSNASYFEYR